MIQQLPIFLVRSLLLTMAMEAGGAYLLGVHGRRNLTVILLAQVVTNPAVVTFSLLANLLYGLTGRGLALALLEPLAILIEGLLYRRGLENVKMNPFLLSLLLNAISFGLGELINLL